MQNIRTSSLIGAARLFLLSLVLIGSVDAVTLGQARVESFLNQPLRATIPLIGIADGQHRDLRLRLANQDDFERLGIAYEEGLADLQFAVVQDSGEWVVRVTTRAPVREPFLDFPLQLSWSGGRLVRQYSLLLDPVSRPMPIREATAIRPAPATPPAARPAPRPAAPVAIVRDTLRVERGDTLWVIADRVKPAGITTRQMAMALLRANPEAFIDGNLNRLRAGVDLQIPPLGFIQQLDASAARAAFASEIRRWRQPAVATPPRTVEGTPAPAQRQDPTAAPPPDAGQETPLAADAEQAVESPIEPATATTAPSPAVDAPQPQPQLRIVGEEQRDAEDPQAALQEQLLVTLEEIETTRINTREVEDRLARLEEELARMEELVALKDDQIATLQSELTTRASAGAPVDPTRPGTAGEPPTVTAPAVPAQTVETRADTPVTASVETLPQRVLPQLREWLDRNLWLLWGVLAAGALLLILAYLYRRRARNRMMVALPVPDQGTPAQFEEQTGPSVSRAEMRAAAQELRAANQRARTARARVGETNARVGRMLDEVGSAAAQGSPSRPAAEGRQERPASTSPRPEAGANDRDIERWAAELRDDSGPVAGSDAAMSADDDLDVPSLLIELDDQVASQRASRPAGEPATPRAAASQGAPDRGNLDEESFMMSLDLARAYLEIGDQEGARDMLSQAMEESTDIGRRQQLEELLRQLDGADRAP